MNSIWFTSDHHFGHKKIMEYQPKERPILCLAEMHHELISRWNEVVKPQDIVYHMGDFCFGRENIKIACLLNGRKNLILGNHDRYPMDEYLPYFNRVMGAHYWKMCVLTHIPVHPENLGSRAFINVHGHLHSKRVQQDVSFGCTEDDDRYMNVSVEQNNLYPFHADQILERLNKCKSD